MTSRFASNLAVMLLGSFLATASFAFAPETVAWLAFAVGAAVTLILMGAFATRERGVAQRTFDLGVLVTAAWTIVASRVFGPGAQQWLAFASAGVFVVLAFAGMVVHEVLLELALRRGTLLTPRHSASDRRERPSLGAVS
ncbi:MAG TPA: hypothetical protein VH025_00580 [Solirubrobacteraceae bacterium]|jgi:hypothetical protein|nr:hypothetical protein [Solirubrobacteraceae bacterium]